MLAGNLRKIRALISEGWCQHASAKDAEGTNVDVRASEAAQFCIIGAIAKVTGNIRTFETPEAEALKELVGNLADYNDTHTKEEVLALVDKGIANVSQGV